MKRFEEIQNVIDRDLGIHAGNSDIIQSLVKAGLKKDYEAQLAQLKSTLDNKTSGFETCCEVISAMGKLVQEAHFLAPEILSLLLKVSKYPFFGPRMDINITLEEVVKAAPTAESCDVFLKIVGDSNLRIRSSATLALGWLVKAAPGHAPKVLETLLKAAGDEDRAVRSVAARALGELAKADRSLASRALKSLLKAAGDEDEDVRSAAASAL
ncbi:MAG: HEAT repeat domain-containing protein, partial [Bacteroidota bacterium]